MIKFTKRDFIFICLGFCIAQLLTNYFGSFPFIRVPKNQGHEFAAPASMRNANDQPSIFNGSFYSPHFKARDLLTDVYLDSLVEGAKQKSVLDVLYGKPSSERREGEVVFANYNLAIYDEVLRKEGGRVGFVATIKKGIITHWSPITQE